MTAPLPAGFRVALDSDTRQLEAGLWIGGSPTRAVRLSAAGLSAWRALRAGPVTSHVTGALARRLTDAGLAHPCPPPPANRPDVTVVVPVRDRPALLESCLTALGRDHPVLVVDDASHDPAGVADVAHRHGARLLRRAVNGGPGPARNTALAHVDTDLVAFVDSDCLPTPGWIERLAAHLADPLVGAVAPRIIAVAPPTWAGRYASANSGLDLGDRSARVAPGTHVAYVPTAALLARRTALLAVARGGEVFDPALRIGEDVDLIWRLLSRGWRVRYEPGVQVGHQEPRTWAGMLARRFRYGTSAAPLALRHPGAVAPLVVRPGAAAAVVALLVGRPGAAATTLAAFLLTTAHTLRAAGLPTREAWRTALTSVHQSWLAIGRYGSQFLAPALLARALAPGDVTRVARRTRRAATACLLLGPVLTTWVTRRPALDAGRYALGAIADDIAYGLGVWTGCLRGRTTVPLRPVLTTPTSPVARPVTETR